MKDYLSPEEERLLVQKIEQTLHALDEPPPASLQPEAITARLKRETAAVPPPSRRHKRWAAAAASLAACIVLGVAAFALLPLPGLSRKEIPPQSDPVPDAATCSSVLPSDIGTDSLASTDAAEGNASGDNAHKESISDVPNAPRDTRDTAAVGQTTQPSVAAPTAAATKTTAKGGATSKATTKHTAKATTGQVSGGLSLLDEAQIAAYTAQNGLVVDVRPSAAFEAGHPDGAVSLPADTAGEADLANLGGRPLVLYGSEADCLRAANALTARGCTVVGYFRDETQ